MQSYVMVVILAAVVHRPILCWTQLVIYRPLLPGIDFPSAEALKCKGESSCLWHIVKHSSFNTLTLVTDGTVWYVYQHLRHYTFFSSVRGLKKRDAIFFPLFFTIFRRFRKIATSDYFGFFMFARPHGTATRLPPDGFS